MKSKINLKGKYTFTLTFNTPLWGTINLNSPIHINKITPEGNEFILRRLYDNIREPIQYVIVAKTKDLETLKESGKSIKISRIDPQGDNGVEFHANFTPAEMEGIEQISLTNKEKNGTIITHSTLNEPFTKIPEGIKINLKYNLKIGE